MRKANGKKTFKAIIFDLDGTLIDSLPYHFLAFRDLLLEHGIRIEEGELKRLIGIPTVDILKELKRKYRFRESVSDLHEERRYHYFKFLGDRDIEFPGVAGALKRLRPRYKLAVATGSSFTVLAHSTKKGFLGMFDAVVTINDVKKGKPDPSQFLLAARRMKVGPAHCIAVGDSIYDGIAAKRAGMAFVGVKSGYNSKKELAGQGAFAVIKSVTELEKILP